MVDELRGIGHIIEDSVFSACPHHGQLEIIFALHLLASILRECQRMPQGLSTAARFL